MELIRHEDMSPRLQNAPPGRLKERSQPFKTVKPLEGNKNSKSSASLRSLSSYPAYVAAVVTKGTYQGIAMSPIALN